MKDIKQTEIGQIIGKTPQFVSKIENGKNKISSEDTEKIAKYFGMNKEELEHLHERLTFHITQNSNSNNGYVVNNTFSENERKAFEDHIVSLKEQLNEAREERASLRKAVQLLEEELRKEREKL